MRTEVSITVSAAGHKRLSDIIAGRNTRQKHVWRARIILLTASGCGTMEIMRRAGKSKTCAWRWQERFMTEGVDGLLRDKTRPPGKAPVAQARVEALVRLTLAPPPRGTNFRISEFPPEDPEEMKAIDGSRAFAEVGAAQTLVAGARHPFMHRTATIDYAIVLEGEITLLLDDSEVDLKAGDVVIQRGTNHAWSNRGEGLCRMAFILIDAEDRDGGGAQ